MAGVIGMRCQMYGVGAGTTFINTIYTENDVATGDWPALAAKCDQDWIRKVNIWQSSSINWHTVVISKTAPGGPASQSFPIARPGALAGLLPMQVALVLRTQTGFAGRSFNGRWFIGGLSTSVNNLGMVSSGTLSGVPTQAAVILAAWSTGNTLGGRLVLWSRKDDAQRIITGITASQAFGTLGSRRFGRGI